MNRLASKGEIYIPRKCDLSAYRRKQAEIATSLPGDVSISYNILSEADSELYVFNQKAEIIEHRKLYAKHEVKREL